jgi:2-iminobutanoate/2-iminopropanoate deaminase
MWKPSKAVEKEESRERLLLGLRTQAKHSGRLANSLLYQSGAIVRAVIKSTEKELLMPKKKVIQVPNLKAIGPYSHAVRSGELLFVSGQPGIDPATGTVAGSSFEAQARQVFRNLSTVLEAGGSRLDLVLNTTVLVTEISNFPELNRLFGEYFPQDPPARMTMQVPLPNGLLISIGCVAVVD